MGTVRNLRTSVATHRSASGDVTGARKQDAVARSGGGDRSALEKGAWHLKQGALHAQRIADRARSTVYLPTYGEQRHSSNAPFKNGEPYRECIYAPHSLSPAAATKLRNSGVV
jgi:hypothetical protein